MKFTKKGSLYIFVTRNSNAHGSVGHQFVTMQGFKQKNECNMCPLLVVSHKKFEPNLGGLKS